MVRDVWSWESARVLVGPCLETDGSPDLCVRGLSPVLVSPSGRGRERQETQGLYPHSVWDVRGEGTLECLSP